MSSITVTPGAAAGHAHDAGADYLTANRGLWSWLLTLDHKRIGVMYMTGIMAFFLIGGLFALLVRTALLVPAKTLLDGTVTPLGQLISANAYNELFTLHGAVMIFIVIIPGIPAALGNFVLPLMLGAKDVAFPRLNLASFYFWCTGVVLLLYAIIAGGVDTGWTFYVPYSTDVNSAMGGVIPALFGAFMLGFSSIFTGLNFVVTIHKMRPPEMGWFQMPLFLWAIYSTGVIQILATPVLGITLLLLIVERAVGIGIFTPALGGDPVLMQHFFWFYSHPAVYIMILPAMGVMSELLTTFSRKHIFGYKFIAYSSVAIAIFGFLVWGHHMFTSGQSNLVSAIFSAITFSVAIPSAIKVFSWLATIYKGSISFKTPMIYALSFIWIFGIGGLTGLFLGTMGVNVHLHDTYFVVAHFHFVMAGTIFVIFGGLHYWWPKITGRMYAEPVAQIAALTAIIGFNITFLPQFVMGSHGATRRSYNYDPQFYGLHLTSTIGAYIAGVGFLVAVLVLAYSLLRGRKASSNPWGAATAEWRTPSPPPAHNFDSPPPVTDPYDYRQVRYISQEAGFEFVSPAAVPPRSGHH